MKEGPTAEEFFGLLNRAVTALETIADRSTDTWRNEIERLSRRVEDLGRLIADIGLRKEFIGYEEITDDELLSKSREAIEECIAEGRHQPPGPALDAEQDEEFPVFGPDDPLDDGRVLKCPNCKGNNVIIDPDEYYFCDDCHHVWPVPHHHPEERGSGDVGRP